jgi:hypothetical protein
MLGLPRFMACLGSLVICVGASAQSITTQPNNGGPGMLRPNPITNPAIQNPSISHIGIWDEWRPLAPKKNVAPTVVRVIGVGKDLHVALFNDRQKDKLESSLAFMLRPFEEKQLMEVQVYAVEQDGRAINRVPLAAPQSIALKKQGAVLPFTLGMKEGESMTCEVVFLVSGKERGRAWIRADYKGLTFAPRQKEETLKK